MNSKPGFRTGGFNRWAVLAVGFLCVAGETPAEDIRRVSVASDGAEANGPSGIPAISADGRYVAFESDASNLVPNDTNQATDIFVHDIETGRTTRVSVGRDGAQANGPSHSPGISGDGRFVAFHSTASNLVPDDTNNEPDVFVHDRRTGRTRRVSVSGDGGQGDGPSWFPSISADGRHVAFESYASNLVPGDRNDARDIFVHDLETGETTRVSVSERGTEANDRNWLPGSPAWSRPGISVDGRYVAFVSWATNLAPGGGGNESDVFVRDRHTGRTTRASIAVDGIPGHRGSYAPGISADGRFVAFQSAASNLAPPHAGIESAVFVHDRESGRTKRVGIAGDGALPGGARGWSPSVSGNGRLVAFSALELGASTGGVNERGRVLVHDLFENRIVPVGVALDGGPADGSSWSPAISADGVRIAFRSYASNLVPEDTNGTWDVFLQELTGRVSGDTGWLPGVVGPPPDPDVEGPDLLRTNLGGGGGAGHALFLSTRGLTRRPWPCWDKKKA